MKTVLITGCSSGIGLDAARTLHRRGWRVLATCRREEDCATLQAEGLESFRLDYTDPASIGAAMAEALVPLRRCAGRAVQQRRPRAARRGGGFQL